MGGVTKRRHNKKSVVLTYRYKEAYDMIGLFPTREEAMRAAVEHLQSLGVSEEDWEEAVEHWEDLTDGYEEYIFEETGTP